MTEFSYKGLIFTVINSKKRFVGVGRKSDPYQAIDYTNKSVINIPNMAVNNGKRYIVTEILEKAFYWCNITGSTIPSTITRIHKRAFYKCYYQKTVIFEENSSLKRIDEYAFYDNLVLETIYVPSKCIKIIENYAFLYTIGATTVFLGSAAYIGNKAFSSMRKLTNFYFCGSNTIDNPLFTHISGSAYNTSYDISIYTTSSYEGDFGQLPVKDKSYICPVQQCINQNFDENSCTHKSKRTYLVFFICFLSPQ